MRFVCCIGPVGLAACTSLGDLDLDPTVNAQSQDPSPTPAVASPLWMSGPIECADPTARYRLGPLYEAPLGEAFAQQRPAALEGADPFPSGGVAVVDFTGDGLMDYFLPADTPCMLFVGQEDGTVVDESIARIPLAETDCRAWGAAAGDMDGDGDLDLYIPRERYPDLLWENDGTGHFTDVSEAAGIPDMSCGSRSASWGDMDGDGDLDLFVARHRVILSNPATHCPAPEAPESWELESGGANLLLRNDGDGTFTDVSDRLPFRGIYAFSFIGGWYDIDRDHDLDLLLINDFGARTTPNSTWINNGAGRFEELNEDAGLRLSIFGMGISATDINDDGRPDFAITDIERLHLMRSVDLLSWVDDATARALHPDTARTQFAAWGTALEDFDNDGLVDVAAVYGPTEEPLASRDLDVLYQPDALFIQHEDGHFEDQAALWDFDSVAVGRGLVVADLDGNGWLDFVRPNYRMGPTRVHYQRCGSEAWITVTLDGPNHGYGARIEIEAGGVRQIRWMDSTNESLASTGPAQVHFGLGQAESVELLRVIWPDGSIGYNRNIEARQHLVVGAVGQGDG